MTTVAKMRQKQTTSSASKPPEPTPPTAARPTLRYSCGHERPVADLAGKQCPACQRATAARRHAKKEAKPARLDAAHGRLPDGAECYKQYDAATQTWTATLATPGLPPLEASASGSFTVERQLDRMYRQQLREIAGEPSPDDNGG